MWTKQKINGLSAQHGRKSTIPYSERALHLTIYVYLNETVIELCANFSHEGFA